MIWLEKNLGISYGQLLTFGRVLVVLAIAILSAKLIIHILVKMLRKHISAQSALLLRKFVFYFFVSVAVIMAMRELGLRIGTLLGAAGILGIAIGLAAQTSLSNLISGLFFMWEKPFELGDHIKVDSHSGIVDSIELLAVTLRTFNNRFVRIPNEHLLKTSFTNVTHFPVRRLDIDVGVAYKQDVDHVMLVLKKVADKNPYSLDEPEPLVLFKGFGASSLEFMLGVWFVRNDYIELMNSIHRDIKKAFDEEGIEIPFPHVSLYAGSKTQPFPVRIEQGQAPAREDQNNTQ